MQINSRKLGLREVDNKNRLFTSSKIVLVVKIINNSFFTILFLSIKEVNFI